MRFSSGCCCLPLPAFPFVWRHGSVLCDRYEQAYLLATHLRLERRHGFHRYWRFSRPLPYQLGLVRHIYNMWRPTFAPHMRTFNFYSPNHPDVIRASGRPMSYDLWREGRDSNPRRTEALGNLAGCWFKPLTHPHKS